MTFGRWDCGGDIRISIGNMSVKRIPKEYGHGIMFCPKKRCQRTFTTWIWFLEWPGAMLFFVGPCAMNSTWDLSRGDQPKRSNLGLAGKESWKPYGVSKHHLWITCSIWLTARPGNGGGFSETGARTSRVGRDEWSTMVFWTHERHGVDELPRKLGISQPS